MGSSDHIDITCPETPTFPETPQREPRPLRGSGHEGLLLLALILLILTACARSAPAPTLTPQPGPSPTPQPTQTQLSPEPASSLPTPRPRRLRPGELLLAAEDDAIPAIFAEDALFVGVEEGSAEWSDDEGVIGVVIEDDARAFPIRLLSLHEIVNDVVGGRPVAITWCPLCFSAIVFDRVVEGRELTFGVSGYLYRNNLVMYDHQTDTLWSQLLGQGLLGAHDRERLEVVPSVMSTWGQWKTEHPQTRILSAEKMGRRSDEIVDPYAGYYGSGAAGLTGQAEEDERLKPKTLVAGVALAGETRAYPLEEVRNEGVINDTLATVPILVAYDETLDAVRVYERSVAGETLTFEDIPAANQLRDVQSGTLWDLASGRATEGAYEGATLQRLAAPLVFWFAWSDLHPETGLYQLRP